MKVWISILVVLLALFVSCERREKFNFPEMEPAIVINSILVPESPFSVHISVAMPVSDSYVQVIDTDEYGYPLSQIRPNPKFIDNASVMMYEDGVLLCTLEHTEDGYYVSDKCPKVGSTYMLVVNAPGYKECRATTIIQSPPVLSNMNFRDTVTIDNEGYPLSEVSFTITDNSPSRNFYELNGRVLSKNPEIDYGRIYFNASRTTDKVLTQSECLPFNRVYLLFTDDYFSNASHNLSAIYNGPRTNYDLEITLKSVSESYYEYRRSTFMQEYEDEGLFEWIAGGESLSSIPVDIYSNIENGYGIFASYSIMTDTIMHR